MQNTRGRCDASWPSLSQTTNDTRTSVGSFVLTSLPRNEWQLDATEQRAEKATRPSVSNEAFPEILRVRVGGKEESSKTGQVQRVSLLCEREFKSCAHTEAVEPSVVS